MLFPFDINQLKVQHVKLKTITTALGGSMTIVDPENNLQYKRIAIPFAVARQFIKTNKETKYLTAVDTAIVVYDQTIIAIERNPYGVLDRDLSDRWIPNVVKNINNIVKPMTTDDQWYFDQRYIYNFRKQSVEQAIKNGTPLTEDKMFVAVDVDTIDCHKLSFIDKITIRPRATVAVVTKNKTAITPPVWSNCSTILSRKKQEDDDEIDGDIVYSNTSNLFDTIDNQLSVNISFVLKAADILGTMFNVSNIEPFQLPLLMIEHNTVNLPALDRSIKQTHSANIEFTHSFALICSLLASEITFDQFVQVKQLLKYLTTTGVFKKNVKDKQSVFLENVDPSDVKPIAFSKLLEESSKIKNIIGLCALQ